MSFLYPGHSEWCFPVVLDHWDNVGETFLLKKKSKLLCKIFEKINTDIHLCIGRQATHFVLTLMRNVFIHEGAKFLLAVNQLSPLAPDNSGIDLLFSTSS